ncbi:MAG: EcsC family protein [Pseudomonadota bacterium]
METLPAPLTPDLAPEIAALARRYRRANGPVMALVNRLGGSLESQMAVIPASVRARLEGIVAEALSVSYGLAGHAARLPDMGPRGPLAAAMASGAAGGAGGIATSLAELPVTITLILHAIQREAAAAGYDPRADWVRAECLRVFGAGSPLAQDDGINTSFLSARLTITGPALQKIIATVAPKLAAALGQKLMAQAVPVIGAVAGAGLNAAFVTYYTEMARIRFRLLTLSETHGVEPVLAAFARAVEPAKITKA